MLDQSVNESKIKHHTVLCLSVPSESPGGSRRRRACHLVLCPLSAAGSPLEHNRVKCRGHINIHDSQENLDFLIDGEITIGSLCVRLDLTPLSEPELTIVGDIWNLEAFATVALVGLELNPELARARGEGDGPLVGLTRLIGGDGGGKRCRKRTNVSACE